jgi:hypothetical protein
MTLSVKTDFLLEHVKHVSIQEKKLFPDWCISTFGQLMFCLLHFASNFTLHLLWIKHVVSIKSPYIYTYICVYIYIYIYIVTPDITDWSVGG